MSFSYSRHQNIFPEYVDEEARRPSGWVRHISDGLTLPYWSLALGFVLLPGSRYVLAVRSRRRAHRERAGRCPACDYDLRASPERRPECGTSAAANS